MQIRAILLTSTISRINRKATRSPMKTVRDVMTTDVIRVGPTNKIKTAIILMKGHNIGGLPVMDGDHVIGVLDYHDILGKDNDIPVQNVMDRDFVTIPSQMPVIDAADLMSKINASRLLVIDSGQLTGILTRGNLLPELGKSFDPITGLPRADAMRDWGISALKSGNEVTVIFLDLDRFGKFNKQYGHIIGDRVLQHVARVLRHFVDPDRDMLCRYAGDEFVIVTMRTADEAVELGQTLEEAIESTPNEELPEPVTGSVGIRGGKRTKEREDVHYNSTLDNLINLASRACTLAKIGKHEAANALAEQTELNEQPVPVALLEADLVFASADGLNPVSITDQPIMDSCTGERDAYRRLKLQSLNFSWDGSSMATAEVVLSNGDIISKQSRSGFAMGHNALRLVAEATAQAVCDFLPTKGYGVVTENVELIHAGNGVDVVVTTALFITPQNQIRVSGSCLVKQDTYRSVSASFLNAINRQVAMLLAT